MTEIFVFCAVGHKVVKILMKYQRKRLDNIALLVLAIDFFVVFIQIKIKKGRHAMPLQRLFQRVDVVENGFVPVLLRMEANSILFQCIGAVLPAERRQLIDQRRAFLLGNKPRRLYGIDQNSQLGLGKVRVVHVIRLFVPEHYRHDLNAVLVELRHVDGNGTPVACDAVRPYALDDLLRGERMLLI